MARKAKRVAEGSECHLTQGRWDARCAGNRLGVRWRHDDRPTSARAGALGNLSESEQTCIEARGGAVRKCVTMGRPPERKAAWRPNVAQGSLDCSSARPTVFGLS